MAQMLAQSQGKLLSTIRFEGEDPKLDAEYYQPFFQVLVHLFRNAIDHGIESPSERSPCGKPAVASIPCQLQRQGESLKLTISDDGNGPDDHAGNSGFGPKGIHERIELLGGSVHVAALPGGGFQVNIAVPV